VHFFSSWRYGFKSLNQLSAIWQPASHCFASRHAYCYTVISSILSTLTVNSTAKPNITWKQIASSSNTHTHTHARTSIHTHVAPLSASVPSLPAAAGPASSPAAPLHPPPSYYTALMPGGAQGPAATISVDYGAVTWKKSRNLDP